MDTRPNCPECGKPVPPGVPLGLCPECLVKSGFETGTAPGARNKNFVPPGISEIAKAFPQFEIINLIGQGGMGAVYKVRQSRLDRFVALKILPPQSADNPGFAERFNREARALARLNHPNIVMVHDFGSAELPTSGERAATLHYLLMEFVDGTNLRELERAQRLKPEQALQIIPQICDALQFAHTEGVIHRDIKPENILLDQKGRVKITDFGIAKIIGAAPEYLGLTGACDVIGTPHYMAPEQVERPNAVDHRADIYSLGVVFYELLTGELPLGKFAPPSSKVPVDARLDSVVLRTLEKEPARRYQHAGEVKTDMQTIAATPAAAALPKRPSMPVPVAPSSPPRRTGLWIAAGVAAAFVFVGLAGVAALLFVFRLSTSIQPVETHNGSTNQPSAINPRAEKSAGNLGAKELTDTEPRDILIDLKSSSPALRQIAAHKLALAKPGAHRAEVETELLTMLDSPDWPARQSAARALGAWGTTNSVEPLIRMLDDSIFSVRWAVIEALSKIKDPRAIEPLAKHLAEGKDISQAADALKSFGVAAEAPAIALLQNGNSESRRAACGILREVGAKKSIPALTAAASDSDGIVAMLAKDALNAIDARQQLR